MPEIFEHLLQKNPIKIFSKIKESCLALINDRDVVSELIALIEETIEYLRPEKRVNHIRRILKIG